MKTNTKCRVFSQTAEVSQLGEVTLFTFAGFDEILMKKASVNTSGRKPGLGWGANVSC
jgi:hypothetical protein